jgi:hypothetical protein
MAVFTPSTIDYFRPYPLDKVVFGEACVIFALILAYVHTSAIFYNCLQVFIFHISFQDAQPPVWTATDLLRLPVVISRGKYKNPLGVFSVFPFFT